MSGWACYIGECKEGNAFGEGASYKSADGEIFIGKNDNGKRKQGVVSRLVRDGKR